MPALEPRNIRELGDSGIVRNNGISTHDIEAIKAAEKRGEDDFAKQLKREAQQRQADAKSSGGLAVSLFDPVSGLSADALLSPAERTLRAAQACIQQKKFGEALAHLATLLKDSPGHHQGLYLQAYCYWGMEKAEDALRSLLPLRQARLTGKLESQVGALGAEIRARMTLPVMLMNVLLLDTGALDEAIGNLRRVLQLDPQVGIYHYMLAGDLMTAERHVEARASVAEGLRWCRSGKDAEMLKSLASQIERSELLYHLRTARDRYRRGNYPRARSALRDVPEEYHKHALYRTFSAYLEALGGSLFGLVAGNSPAQMSPKGSFKDVDALHFFLVDKEISQAKALLSDDDCGAAQRILEGALGLTPAFPYAHHLMAVCLYRGAAEALTQGSIDFAAQTLGEAERHAQRAASDREIESNGDLLEKIKSTADLIKSIQHERAARRAEVEQVNGAIREYQAAMELAKGGIRSTDHLEHIYQSLQKVRRRIPELKLLVARRREAKEAIDQLDEAVVRDCEQLDNMRGEIAEGEKVSALMERFGGIMKNTEKGISSRCQFREIREALGNLKREIAAQQGRIQGKQGREALGQLRKAVERDYAQFDEAEFDKAQEINNAMGQFNAAMSAISGGITSRDELQRLVSTMRDLHDKVESLKFTIRSGPGRERIDDLAKAIASVLKQAEGHL